MCDSERSEFTFDNDFQWKLIVDFQRVNEARENVMRLVKFWGGKQRPEIGVTAHAQYIVHGGSNCSKMSKNECYSCEKVACFDKVNYCLVNSSNDVNRLEKKLCQVFRQCRVMRNCFLRTDLF